jgi:DNA-damage-inducible protein D
MAEIEHTQPHRQTFESIRHEDDGVEYWRARELGPALGYEKYDNFLQVIRKARIACVQSGMS